MFDVNERGRELGYMICSSNVAKTMDFLSVSFECVFMSTEINACGCNYGVSIMTTSTTLKLNFVRKLKII